MRPIGGKSAKALRCSEEEENKRSLNRARKSAQTGRYSEKEEEVEKLRKKRKAQPLVPGMSHFTQSIDVL